MDGCSSTYSARACCVGPHALCRVARVTVWRRLGQPFFWWTRAETLVTSSRRCHAGLGYLLTHCGASLVSGRVAHGSCNCTFGIPSGDSALGKPRSAAASIFGYIPGRPCYPRSLAIELRAAVGLARYGSERCVNFASRAGEGTLVSLSSGI